MNTLENKWGIIIGNSFGSVLYLSFVWFICFLSQSSQSGEKFWIILILLNFLLGVISLLIVLVLKDAWLHYFWKMIIDFIGACSMLYGVHVTFFSMSTINYVFWFIFTLLIITGWVISYYYANRGINKNLGVNIINGVINVDNGLWDLQKILAYTSTGGDETKRDRILAIGRVLIPLGSALGIMISRSNSISFSTIAIAFFSAFVLFLISTSGQSAGIAKFIKTLEKDIKKKFRLKTLR